MSADATSASPVLPSPAPLPPAPAAAPTPTDPSTETPPSPTAATTDSTPSPASPPPQTFAEKDVVAHMHVVQPISVDARVEDRYNLETPVSQNAPNAPGSDQGDGTEASDQCDAAEEKADGDANQKKKDDENVEQGSENNQSVEVEQSTSGEEEKEDLPEDNPSNSRLTTNDADGSQHNEDHKGIEESNTSIEAEETGKRGEKRVGPGEQPQAPLDPTPQEALQAEESPAKKRKTDSDGAADANTESKASTGDSSPKAQPIPSTPSVSKVQTVSTDANKGIPSSQGSKTPGASVVGTGMQLMLRSSPVDVNVSASAVEGTPRRLASSRGSNAPGLSEKGGLRSAVAEKGDSGLATAAPGPPQQRTAGEPRKKKSVRWASEGKLVDVRFIDSRLELLRSWDPESEITIPFSAAQVHLLRAEEQNRADAERAAQNNGGQPGAKKLTPFEAARKKEHDMELERAKQAREELQKRLDSMQPARHWEHPAEIILPAECRIDPDSVEGYSLVEEGYRANLRKRDPNSATPPSPPPELQTSRDELVRSEADIPTFPLCDGAAPEAGEVHDSPHSSGARSRGDGRHDSAMHQRYDDNMGNHRMMGGGEGQLHDADHSDDQQPGFRMDPHDRMDRGEEPGMAMNRMPERMDERGGRPYHPEKLQQILSKLRSSGLFNQSSGLPGSGMENPEDYPEGARAEGLDGRSGMYDDQRGPPGRTGGRHDSGYHPNNGYSDDGQRGQGMDDGMGAGPGMGMGNGGMGPPQPGFGHPGQIPPGFPQHVQQGGMMDGFPFMAPIPPPPMGIGPNMLPMGMGMPMPPMGMPMPFGMGPNPMPMGNSKKGGKGGKSGGNGNRVETISRPKSKGPKQRKRCKYFGTKQGCRDGASCVFAHN